LAVVGAVMLSLESFSRLARRAHVKDSDQPMDIDPSQFLSADGTAATALSQPDAPTKEGA